MHLSDRERAVIEAYFGLGQPELTLEEIFIYELGGADYEVKDIVL